MSVIGEDAEVEAALAAFRRLGGPLGLKLGTFSATLIAARTDPGQVILRLNDGERVLYLKRVTRPEGIEDLVAQAEAQERARSAMRGLAGLRVPRILAVGPAEQAVLMEQAEGRVLETSLLDGDAPTPLLSRAGAWAAGFHGATKEKVRPYRPDFMQRHLDRMAADVTRRPGLVPDAPAFLSALAALAPYAAAAEGRPVLSAQGHGELLLRHLILSVHDVWAIGFRRHTTAPVAFDMARLAMDAMLLALPPSDTATGLPAAVTNGLFGSYPLLAPDDPVFAFLLRVRLVTEWRSLPGKAAARSWRQDRRLAAIRALAPVLLPDAFGASAA